VPTRVITREQLGLPTTQLLPVAADAAAPQDSALAADTFREAREEFEKDFLLRKLEEYDWNVSKTAEAIEIERSNLHRKIRSYGIEIRK